MQSRNALNLLILLFALLWPAIGTAQSVMTEEEFNARVADETKRLQAGEKTPIQREIENRIQLRMEKLSAEMEKQKAEAAKQQQILQDALAKRAQTQANAPQTSSITTGLSCQRTGCNGELCMQGAAGASNTNVASTCVALSFYGCYKDAQCVTIKTETGQDDCRWQDTPALRTCLLEKGGETGLRHARLK